MEKFWYEEGNTWKCGPEKSSYNVILKFKAQHTTHEERLVCVSISRL